MACSKGKLCMPIDGHLYSKARVGMPGINKPRGSKEAETRSAPASETPDKLPKVIVNMLTDSSSRKHSAPQGETPQKTDVPTVNAGTDCADAALKTGGGKSVKVQCANELPEISNSSDAEKASGDGRCQRGNKGRGSSTSRKPSKFTDGGSSTSLFTIAESLYEDEMSGVSAFTDVSNVSSILSELSEDNPLAQLRLGNVSRIDTFESLASLL
eukprot:TRINITY_DN40754_c0_g1_i2.p1 TRINITY_DN40754_c0_g1~~TRINITY_DN40754_c0_g1_i2.p1  ORF type:complete len:213 (-),score=32.27 TRINITY_DN40754_c0_g1_i2:535-1173(-)